MHPGDIVLSWVNNAGIEPARDTDQIVMVTCFHTLDEIAYKLSDRKRADESAKIEVYGLTDEAHVWIGLVSEDDCDVSDSVYAGILTV